MSQRVRLTNGRYVIESEIVERAVEAFERGQYELSIDGTVVTIVDITDEGVIVIEARHGS